MGHETCTAGFHKEGRLFLRGECMLPQYALTDLYRKDTDHRIPDFLLEAVDTGILQRIGHIGMNCGCEYTSFERFRNGRHYTRLSHSLGVSMIVWKHTGDPAQAMAGLLHDIATPVFAHVIDFLKGDYLKQEATEKGTAEMISHSQELQKVLEKYGLKTEQVSNYHLYPIADNESPCLCADRLEYTLGNTYFFEYASLAEIEELYADVHVGKTEDGKVELVFQHPEQAERFGYLGLKCSEVYVSDEDRYAMQALSEIVGMAIRQHVLSEKDLYGTEERVTEVLSSSPQTQAQWKWFCCLNRIERAAEPGEHGRWRCIKAKKRCIDPWIENAGRLSRISARFSDALTAFQNASQEDWLRGYSEGR